MRVAIVDFETTGTDRVNDRPWGWAVATCDEDFKIIKVSDGQMWANDYPDIPAVVQELCGISEVRLDAPHPEHVLPRIIEEIKDCDYVLAYNYLFDKTIFESECERQEITPPESNWLCAMEHVQWERKYRCKQLAHLAFDHGIVETNAHDAKADVVLTAKLLANRGETCEKMSAYRDEPYVYIRADFPKPFGRTEKEGKFLQALAKADGYNWESCRNTDEPKFPKMWVKRVKESQFEAETAEKRQFKRFKVEAE